MNSLNTSLLGLIPFLSYFGIGLLMLMSFLALYTWMTPYNEMKLIKENNSAASLVMSAAGLGFCLPLASAAANSTGPLDFVIWALIACAVQLITYQVFRRFYPRVNDRILAGEMAVSINLAAISLTVGILNAACMTY